MDLARYCEAMLYDYEPEWRPSGMVELDRADVLAWKRPGWPVGYSRVAYAKWTAGEAEARIDGVLAFFGDIAFNWHVGPSSAPHDLVDRLTTRGLIALARPRMMTIGLPLAEDWPIARDVRIAEVDNAETARVALRLAHHEGPALERDVAERVAYLENAWPPRRVPHCIPRRRACRERWLPLLVGWPLRLPHGRRDGGAVPQAWRSTHLSSRTERHVPRSAAVASLRSSRTPRLRRRSSRAVDSRITERCHGSPRLPRLASACGRCPEHILL